MRQAWARGDDAAGDAAFEDLWEQGAYTDRILEDVGAGGERFSISRTEDGQLLVTVENDILKDVPKSEWVRTVKNNLKLKFPNGITVGNDTFLISNKSRNEITSSKYSRWLRENNPAVYADKMRATDNMDELMGASTGWVNEAPRHQRNDEVGEFARGKVRMRIGGREYAADVLTAKNNNGILTIHDIVDLVPVKINEKETDTAISGDPSPGAQRSAVSISKNSISHGEGNVNPYLVGQARKYQAMGLDADEVFRETGIRFDENNEPYVPGNASDAVQYSISETYSDEIDQWDKEGRYPAEVFVLGSTGDVLQGLGAMENDIYLNGDKINKILNDHPEMTIEQIKKIPQILDDPVLILKSKNVGRAGRNNTRMVIYGAVKAQNGNPVLCVLDLRPVENKLVIDGMQKVNSAYTKSGDAVKYVLDSDVLYADKKRTAPLLLNDTPFLEGRSTRKVSS